MGGLCAVSAGDPRGSESDGGDSFQLWIQRLRNQLVHAAREVGGLGRHLDGGAGGAQGGSRLEAVRTCVAEGFGLVLMPKEEDVDSISA